jgi:excisionase family DNA binding protein
MGFSLFTVNKVLRFPLWERMRDHEFLKPHEAAKLLKVSEVEFLDAVYKGDIPGKRIGGRWRFSQTELMRLCKLRNDRNPTPCLREESMYFFDDEEAHEGRAERIIEAYKE